MFLGRKDVDQVGMIRPQGALGDGQCPFEVGSGGLELSLLPIEHRQMGQRQDQVGMVGAEEALVGRERALEHGARPIEAQRLQKTAPEAGDQPGDGGMSGPNLASDVARPCSRSGRAVSCSARSISIAA